MSRLPPLTLYTRRGCHLCEQAEERLRLLDFPSTPVDVDTDPALRARYGDDVPVLAMPGREGEDRVLLKGVLSRARLSELKLRLLREVESGEQGRG